MSKANDWELASQLRVLERACQLEGCDIPLARISYNLGAYAAFRIAVKLIAARDSLKALNECGRLLKALHKPSSLRAELDKPAT